MRTVRYNTETQAYSKHIGQYKTMDGNYGAIHPPVVQLEVIETEKPEMTEFQRATMHYDFQVNEEIDVYGINGTATQVWTVETQPEYDPETEKLTGTWGNWQVVPLTDYELALRDWKYPEWAKRIIAPLELALDDTGAKIAIWFQLNGFPIEKIDDSTVHLYCNVILPQHQTIVDGFGELVTIEDRPQILGT